MPVSACVDGVRLRSPGAETSQTKKRTVEIISNSDGEVTIEGFYVFEPPEK